MYDLEGERFVQRYSKGIKAGDLKRIEAVLEENRETIVNSWKVFFKNKKYGDQENLV